MKPQPNKALVKLIEDMDNLMGVPKTEEQENAYLLKRIQALKKQAEEMNRRKENYIMRLIRNLNK